MIKGKARRIHILRDSVARQIAAGEVIDRPFSVVRELLDNSIDAGAASIDVYVEAGGIGAVRVVDNGAGMVREDLELCWHSHATSKIEQVQDLDRLASLGFRGEALSSIAACSRLTITSRRQEAASAHRLRVESGKLLSLEEAPGEAGTVVDVADLFYSLPGRRKFLKTPSAETAMCRSTFVEKSLPFPNVAMRFSTGRELKLFLPAVETLDERAVAAHPSVLRPELIHRVDTRAATFSVSIVMGGPSLYRRDRRYVWTYVNNRRINEYALIQAVEYGFADHIPGGHFPVAFVFISVDPDLVDFNVHPAKREVRFRNLPEIHHALVTALKDYLGRFAVRFDRPANAPLTSVPPQGQAEESQAADGPTADDVREPQRSLGSSASGHAPGAPPADGFAPRFFGSDRLKQALAGPGGHRGSTTGGRDRFSPLPSGPPAEALTSRRSELIPRPVRPEQGDIHYYGQLFELFLIASVGERLFIIDQHAAHERILFERFRARPGAPQNLLVPITFEATADEERLLETNLQFCAGLGITIRKSGQGLWEVLSLPEGFHSMEEEIVSFVKQAKGTKRELEQELYARLSCRAAVKEGDAIDEITAIELIRQAFALENARCPHGRPIWYELSRTELYHLVGRL